MADTLLFEDAENKLKSAVSRCSSHPRAAVEWIGAVEDATRPQDVMTPAPFRRKVIPDLEGLESNIANRLR